MYIHTYVDVYIYICLRIREWQMRYTTSSFLSLSDRLNPRPAFLFKVRAFGYGRRNGFRVVRRLNRSRFDRVQRNDVHCKFSIAMFRRYYFFGEFEFGAFDASSFFFTEGVCASVINDSSRIIYRPLIRGWIKASAIKLRNICAALPFSLSPPFSLSLYLPPRLHPLLRFVRNYEDGNNRRMGFFQGWGKNSRGKIILRDAKILSPSDARFFLAAVSRGGGVRGGRESGLGRGSDLLFERIEGWGGMQISKHASSVLRKARNGRPSPPLSYVYSSRPRLRRSTRR